MFSDLTYGERNASSADVLSSDKIGPLSRRPSLDINLYQFSRETTREPKCKFYILYSARDYYLRYPAGYCHGI